MIARARENLTNQESKSSKASKDWHVQRSANSRTLYLCSSYMRQNIPDDGEYFFASAVTLVVLKMPSRLLLRRA
ncbi:hypothetical protein ALC53_06734 [Atta colombica]|uniref:Uncharacterized protein n=1 Tax=Atta colombica TaxID=520822 RepID=A0A151I3K5_9HYME|nr:hypothetical protein ALC53_06734 [Atta colombica]